MIAWLPAVLTAALIIAAVSIISAYRGLTTHQYLFKPLPVLLMIIVVIAAPNVSNWVKMLFTGGLIASAIGDVLLIDRRRFIYGLIAFLIAHVFYIFGLWWLLEQEPRVLLVLPFTLWGGVLFWMLRRHLQNKEFPVLIYISIITVMVWLAAEWFYQTPHMGSSLLLAGAISFALSDTILAIDHFRQPFILSKFFILSTYYLAQISIAFALVFV